MMRVGRIYITTVDDGLSYGVLTPRSTSLHAKVCKYGARGKLRGILIISTYLPRDSQWRQCLPSFRNNREAVYE
jgi:hypothetical protein